jgi:hypothetical protein
MKEPNLLLGIRPIGSMAGRRIAGDPGAIAEALDSIGDTCPECPTDE